MYLLFQKKKKIKPSQRQYNCKWITNISLPQTPGCTPRKWNETEFTRDCYDNSSKSTPSWAQQKQTVVRHAAIKVTSLSFKFTAGDVTSDMILVDKMCKSWFWYIFPGHRALNFSALQSVCRYKKANKTMSLYRDNRDCYLHKSVHIKKLCETKWCPTFIDALYGC